MVAHRAASHAEAVEDPELDVGALLLAADSHDDDDAESGTECAVRRGVGMESGAFRRVVRTAGPLGAFAAACALLVLARRGSAGAQGPSSGVAVEQGVVGLRALAPQQRAAGQPVDIAAIKAAHPHWHPHYWDTLVAGRKAFGALAPNENLNDGNKCETGEEEFGGLCYTTCATLTGNEYPIRTTAFTCCEEHPCHPFNSKREIGVCAGFSVGGGEGKSCPHLPGGCLVDEEMLGGRCYKKCSILTHNEFTHRIAPVVCCKMALSYRCAFSGNHRFSRSFDVGGGKGDNDKSTPSYSHTPMPQLTEASDKSR